ncbi:hypothetical protein KCP70_19120 [Salmonella enterica subsp. enterica]|nr:hypothetical protein KCP70_19120 [Salmonella enterica subsp. enterica]
MAWITSFDKRLWCEGNAQNRQGYQTGAYMAALARTPITNRDVRGEH